MVTVKFGAQEMRIRAAGKSIAEIMDEVRDVIGLRGDETARANNDGTVGTDYRVREGDVVEFVKPSGSKG